VSPTKPDERIEMEFGLWTRVGPSDHYMGTRISRGKAQF